jgi:hypothetical protein
VLQLGATEEEEENDDDDDDDEEDRLCRAFLCDILKSDFL